jgi:hypothetical protein
MTEFKEKLRSIQFATKVVPQTLMEKRWEKDMPAYKRLRMNGVQPAQIDGSAKLEQEANHPVEVQMGHRFFNPDGSRYNKQQIARAVEGVEAAREIREGMEARGESTIVRPKDLK